MELICQFYNIRRREDLRKISITIAPSALQEIQKELSKTRLFRSVEKSPWPSPAGESLHLWPVGSSAWGVEIVVSRITPIFYTDFLRKEGWDRKIDLSLLGRISKSDSYIRYKRALKKPISMEAKRFRNKLLTIMASKGIIHVPENVLDKHPTRANIPSFLRKMKLQFFYFYSIPLF